MPLESDYRPSKDITNDDRSCPVCGVEMKEVRGGRTNTDTTFSVELQCMNFGVCNHRLIYEVHVPYVEIPGHSKSSN